MPEFNDLTGQRFGRWAVIERAENGKARQTRWLCKCDCGTEKIVQAGHLRNGKTKSCGCYNSDVTAERNHTIKKKHGGAIHTRRERLYKIFISMHHRCEKEYHPQYERYGGRGISVCDEWSGEHGYENFRNWAFQNGFDPTAKRKDMSIDRIDNDGNYEPSNCRWTSYKQQSNNRRSNHLITIDGITHTISEWADIVEIDQRTISSRIFNGWSEQDAVLRPKRVW